MKTISAKFEYRYTGTHTSLETEYTHITHKQLAIILNYFQDREDRGEYELLNIKITA